MSAPTSADALEAVGAGAASGRSPMPVKGVVMSSTGGTASAISSIHVIIRPSAGQEGALAPLVAHVRERTGRGPITRTSFDQAWQAAAELLSCDPGAAVLLLDDDVPVPPGAPPDPASWQEGADADGSGDPGDLSDPTTPDLPARLRLAALHDCLEPGGLGHLDALLELMAETMDQALGGALVCVTGARGGLGASCLLLLLARELVALGVQVAVVDADPAGGLGLLLGQDLGRGLAWADLPDDELAFRPHRLAGALPLWRGVPVLTGDDRGGPADPARLGPVLDALRVAADMVLVDLPRAWPAPPGSHVLVVTGLDLRSALAARSLVPRLTDESGRSVALVVRPVGEDLAERDLLAVTGAVVLGEMPTDRAVAQRAARGDDVTRGRGAARRYVRGLAQCLHVAALDDLEWRYWTDAEPEALEEALS